MAYLLYSRRDYRISHWTQCLPLPSAPCNLYNGQPASCFLGFGKTDDNGASRKRCFHAGSGFTGLRARTIAINARLETSFILLRRLSISKMMTVNRHISLARLCRRKLALEDSATTEIIYQDHWWSSLTHLALEFRDSEQIVQQASFVRHVLRFLALGFPGLETTSTRVLG